MKNLKVLVCLVFAFVVTMSATAGNRKIVIDKIHDDVRVVEALGTKIGGFTATKVLFTGLQLWVSPTDTTCVMVTNVATGIHDLGAMDDALMLIKTMDGEVIELQSITSENNTKVHKIGNPTVTVTKWKNRISTIYNSNEFEIKRNINYWYVTPEIIDKLNKGVKKVKIQFENGVYEKEFKKDEIGHVVYDSYLSELQHVMTTNSNDNFRVDF